MHLASVALPFIENVGQYDPQVAFAAPLSGGTAFVTRDGRIVYSLRIPGRERVSAPNPAFARFLLDAKPIKADLREGSTSARDLVGRDLVLTETLVGATPKPRGGEPSPTNVSVFLGDDPSRWHSTVRTWQSVTLGEVYPGITLEFRARGGSVEKVFVLSPGSDPATIRMHIEGVRGLRVQIGRLSPQPSAPESGYRRRLPTSQGLPVQTRSERAIRSRAKAHTASTSNATITADPW